MIEVDEEREMLARECELADAVLAGLATRVHNAIMGEDMQGNPKGMDLDLDSILGAALDRQSAAYRALDKHENDEWIKENFQ